MGLIGTGHGRPDAVVQHEVGLHRIAFPLVVTGGGNAEFAGMDSGIACGVDHGHLAHGSVLILSQQAPQGFRSGDAVSHEGEALRPVSRVDEGLRGDGADAGLRPGDEAADREPVGLHRHAQLSGLGVPGHDGISVDRAAAGMGGGQGAIRHRGDAAAGEAVTASQGQNHGGEDEGRWFHTLMIGPAAQ